MYGSLPSMVLFLVFLIVRPIWRWMVKRPVLGTLIAIAFYVAGTAAKHVLPNFFCIFTGFQNILFFQVGMLIRDKEERKEKWLADVP